MNEESREKSQQFRTNSVCCLGLWFCFSLWSLSPNIFTHLQQSGSNTEALLFSSSTWFCLFVFSTCVQLQFVQPRSTAAGICAVNSFLPSFSLRTTNGGSFSLWFSSLNSSCFSALRRSKTNDEIITQNEWMRNKKIRSSNTNYTISPFRLICTNKQHTHTSFYGFMTLCLQWRYSRQ